MKKSVLLIVFVLIANTAFSQKEIKWQAVYTYKRVLTEKSKAKRDSLIKKNNPEMAEMIKTVMKKMDNRKYLLDFTKNESVFMEKAKLKTEMDRRMMFMQNPKDRVLYKNLEENFYWQRKPLFEEAYIVKDTLPNYKWQITNDTKTIGKYTVIKAKGTYKNKKVRKEKDKEKNKEEIKEVIAWFTPEIPISNGPKLFNGLPGLIMELTDGEDIYLCTELTMNPKKSNDIKKPNDGKVVSDKEFMEIRKKVMEKMKKRFSNNRSSKGSRTIRIFR